LIWSNDELRSQVLWQLQQWSRNPGTAWRDRLLPFFTLVWPKQRALRTPKMSEKLTDVILESGEMIPALLRLLLPRLVPTRGGMLRSSLIGEDSATDSAQRFPIEMLDLLWAILGDDPTLWPLGAENALNYLATAPETSGDARLSELRRRRER
jgi:hypothetical protein